MVEDPHHFNAIPDPSSHFSCGSGSDFSLQCEKGFIACFFPLSVFGPTWLDFEPVHLLNFDF